MTSFWRKGHWRTSASGNVHYVTGHYVSGHHVTHYSRNTDFCFYGFLEKNNKAELLNDERESLSKENYKKKLLWIKDKINSLNINFKLLEHIDKYKGSYKKAVAYFGNIYDGICEEWMDDFQKEHNLPYTDSSKSDNCKVIKRDQRNIDEYRKINSISRNKIYSTHGETLINCTECNNETVKYNEKLFWIKINIKKLDIDFKILEHLVKYKGSYRKAVAYFGNIYDRIHEEWMDDFQKEHNLPYPCPPEDGWFEKLKQEQSRLEEKWKLEK